MRFSAHVRRRAIWSTVGAVAVAGAITAVGLSNGAPAPVASSTTQVRRGTVTLAVNAAGTVQSGQTRGLAFSVAGTVTEVDVRPGDQVAAGQVLARIDPTDAQAAVDSATTRVGDARDGVDRASVSASVPPCPSPTAVRTPAPTPERTTAPTPERTTAPPPPPHPTQTTQTRTTTPAATKTTPPVQQAQLAEPARAQAPASGSGQSTQNCVSRPSTSDGLLAAQQQYNNALLSLTQAQARLAGTTITAPVAGRVLSVGGKVGAGVSPGGTGFVVLGDVSSLTVRALFTEADVGRLAVGQVSTITLPGRTAAGRVAQIDPAGTVSSRLVEYGVVIAFDEAEAESGATADLLLGQSATVTVTTASVDDVLYVSSAAVSGVDNGSGGTATVTVRAGGRDSRRTVTVGLRGDQYTEIRSGLAEGDEVVLASGT